MNLKPWLDNDLAAQEQEGYKCGQRHCKEGWCMDCADHANTPYMRGYRRGWDDANAAGLHGTEPHPWSRK